MVFWFLERNANNFILGVPLRVGLSLLASRKKTGALKHTVQSLTRL
jgi:hypothetical protein